MKKALLVIAALLCNLLLESIVFVRINLWGLLPDSIIAVVATIALVGGGRKAGAYGVAAGLLIGILFGKYIGLEALIYLLLALLCGVFTHKYYADNWIFHIALGAGCYLLKEGMMALGLKLLGNNVNFFGYFLRYFLPSALLTGLMVAPLYAVYSRMNKGQLRRSRRQP